MSLSGTTKRLDQIDSTLYTTILDSSAVRAEGNIASRTIIWYEIVPFVRNKRWRVKSCRKRGPQQCLNGNLQSGSKTASKDAICTREKHVNKEKTVNEPMFVRLVGGTTQLADCKLTSSS